MTLSFDYSDAAILGDQIQASVASDSLVGINSKGLRPLSYIVAELVNASDLGHSSVIEVAVCSVVSRLLRSPNLSKEFVEFLVLGNRFSSADLAIECCGYISNIQSSTLANEFHFEQHGDLIHEIILAQFHHSRVRTQFLRTDLKLSQFYLHKVIQQVAKYCPENLWVLLAAAKRFFDEDWPVRMVEYLDEALDALTVSNCINELSSQSEILYFLIVYVRSSSRFTILPLGLGEPENPNASQSISIIDEHEVSEFGGDIKQKLASREALSRAYERYVEVENTNPKSYIYRLQIESVDFSDLVEH